MSFPTDSLTTTPPPEYRPPAVNITPARGHRGPSSAWPASVLVAAALAVVLLLTLGGAAYLKSNLNDARSDLATTTATLADTKTELAGAKAENVRLQAKVGDLEDDVTSAQDATESMTDSRDDALLCARKLYDLSSQLLDEDYSSALDTSYDVKHDCQGVLNNNGEVSV